MKADKSPVKFAAVTEADFEQLAELRIVAMRESLERVGRFDPERARARLLSSFSPANTRFIIFEKETIGFYATRTSAEGLRLDHLYIHPHFQGRGIGGTVLKKIFQDADERGVPILVGALKQSASNRFCPRHGFVKSGEGEWDIYYVRSFSTRHNVPERQAVSADSRG
jgi:GNAT superfamily N-acetyltransferase